MSAVVLLLVALAVVVATATSVGVRSRYSREELSLLSPEDRARHDQIVAADRALAVAQEAYDSAVSRASARVNAARAPRTLATVGGVVVTQTGVIVDGTVHPFTCGITATVELIAGIQTTPPHRTRREPAGAGPLILTITGPRWQAIVPLPVDLEVQARRFADTLTALSAEAPLHLHRYQTRLAEAEQAHWVAISDTARLDAARRERSVLELDPLDELRRTRAASRHRQLRLSQETK